MTHSHWADVMTVPFNRCFLGVTLVGLLLLGAGCSVIGTGKTTRKVPLPEGIEPSNLGNTVPDTAPKDDIAAFFPESKTEPLTKNPTMYATSKMSQQRTVLERTDSASRSSKGVVKAKELEIQKKVGEATNKSKPRVIEKPVDAVKSGASRNIPVLGKETVKDIVDFLTPDLGIEKAVQSISDAKLLASLQADLAEINKSKAELERIKTIRPGEKYNTLILSGGPSHGAFEAGVICGWHSTGTMPEFDVVTGVSVGSLVGALTFPGADYLAELQRFFNTVKQKPLRGDIWKVKAFPPFGIGTDSAATNEPLKKMITSIIDQPGYIEKVAAEHAKGRRFYVGTTNLDTQRFVSWDMGGIASEGTPASRKLYVQILLASSAMPPLLTPSKIDITIDNKTYTEMHVDGGTTRNLFFYTPSRWPGLNKESDYSNMMLRGAKVYIVIAGKIYNDPEGTNPKLFSVGFRSLGTLMASSQRGELARIYTHCENQEMNFNLAAIEDDFGELFAATDFDPPKLTKLFCYGFNRATSNTVWNTSPPIRAVSEDRARRSANLTTTPGEEVGPLSIKRPRTFSRCTSASAPCPS